MRTVKEWTTKGQKYTLLHHNMKYQLRVEDGHSAILLKLGDVQANQLEDLVEKEDFQNKIINTLAKAAESKHAMLALIASDDDDDLDLINII